MKPEQIERVVATDRTLEAASLPSIDLYMDQVIQLFEQQYGGMRRNPDDPVLTKTMINNYAKGKLFLPVKNKKYTNEHLMLLGLIYEMKGVLSIHDIKETIEPLKELDLKAMTEFTELYRQQKERQLESFEAQAEAWGRSLADMPLTEEKKRALAIATAAHMSDLYRRLAEQLIDENKSTTE